jgi:hypothetical protein
MVSCVAFLVVPMWRRRWVSLDHRWHWEVTQLEFSPP